jgi:hypothetical protein
VGASTSLPGASTWPPGAYPAPGSRVHSFPLPSVLARTRLGPGPCRKRPSLPHSLLAGDKPPGHRRPPRHRRQGTLDETGVGC